MMKTKASQFGAHLAPHLRALFRAAYRLTRNSADAEDLVQETCLKAFAKLDDFAASRSPCGWLLRVQYHLFVDELRHVEHARVRALEAEEQETLSAGDATNPELSACEAENEARLIQAWAQLAKEQRALLALRAEGYSIAEIETITGLSAAVLQARLHRARQSLGRHLKRLADDAVSLPLKENQR